MSQEDEGGRLPRRDSLVTSMRRRGSRSTGFRIVLIGLVAALVMLVAAGASEGSDEAEGATPTDSPDDPIYYVDGARPYEVEGYRTGDEGCVPWSKDRPDFLICGSGVPEGWTPPPEPYYDKQICDAAIKWLDDERARLSDAGFDTNYIAEVYPEIVDSSCLVREPAAGDMTHWTVTFQSAVDASDGVQVPYDPTGGVSWAARA
jgi:hypothetical protein